MRVLRGVDELTDDAARRRICKIEIDREQVADEKKTMCFPSGLIDGDTLVAIRVLSEAVSERPNV